MSKIFIETRVIDQATPVTPDLARHFLLREREGVAVVITGNVSGIMAAFAKRWKRLVIAMRVERAATLSAERIQTLNQQIRSMERLRILKGPPPEGTMAGIYFISPKQVAEVSVSCATVYVLEEIKTEVTTQFSRFMPPGSLLVEYKRETVVG